MSTENEVRREILMRFFTQPDYETHALELAHELRRPHQVVGRELKRLVAAGILAERIVGRTRRVRLVDRSPIVDSTRALFDQTIGVEARLRKALESIKGVRGALVFGSRARGEEGPNSDIDLLVVGKPDAKALAAAVGRADEIFVAACKYWFSNPRSFSCRTARRRPSLSNCARSHAARSWAT